MEIEFRATLVGCIGDSKVIESTKSYPNYPTEKELIDFYNDFKARLNNPGSLYKANELRFEITVDKIFILKTN